MSTLKINQWAIALVLSFVSVWAQAEGKQNILIYGATGNFGGFIMLEALARGHQVTGVSRNPARFDDKYMLFDADFTAVQGDITDYDSVKSLVTGVDVVVVSVMGPGPDNDPETAVAVVAAKNMIRALHELGDEAPRVIQLGGGSTYYVNDTSTQLYDLIPNRVKGTAEDAIMWGHHIALDLYKAEDNIPWTVFTPPPAATMGKRGVRTGEYQLDDGIIEVESDGGKIDIRKVFPQIGGISQEDLAVAIVDEIENGNYIGKRFTASY